MEKESPEPQAGRQAKKGGGMTTDRMCDECSFADLSVNGSSVGSSPTFWCVRRQAWRGYGDKVCEHYKEWHKEADK